LKRAAIDAVKKYGAGAARSEPSPGTMALHMELEEQIAKFKGNRSVRRFPVGIHRECGHGFRDSWEGRFNYFRRTESRLHH